MLATKSELREVRNNPYQVLFVLVSKDVLISPNDITSLPSVVADLLHVALPLILGHRAAQHPLHDLSPYLLHGTAGEFCKGAAAQPFEKPAGEGDEEHQPHIAQRLLLALGVDEPLELEVFQRREKGYRRCKEREEHELHPVVSEVVVDRLIFHKQYPLYIPKGLLPPCRIWTKYNMIPQKKNRPRHFLRVERCLTKEEIATILKTRKRHCLQNGQLLTGI